MPADERPLRDVLGSARRSVVRFSQDARRAGFEANEETLTQLLLARVSPRGHPTVFSRQEESRLFGADWLWWFEDREEWFGVLVQAKRLRADGTGSPYSFDYTPRPSPRDPSPPSQRERLLRASRSLGVPAVYALYNSNLLPRDTPASRYCCDDACEERPWRRLGVAWVPALLVDYLVSMGGEVLGQMLPLDCLGCDAILKRTRRGVARAFAGDAWSEVSSLYTDPNPTLGRRIAMVLVDQMLSVRIGLFRDAARIGPMPATGLGGRVFPVAPDDVGHFSEPYFDHVLRGLRLGPPEHVVRLMEGVPLEEAGPELESVDGVTVVRREAFPISLRAQG